MDKTKYGEAKHFMNKIKRVSPVTDVEIFIYNPNFRYMLSANFLENTERLQKYALATFGDLGKLSILKSIRKLSALG